MVTQITTAFAELIEPPVLGFTDPVEIAQRRLYNKAGITLEINGSAVMFTTANGTTLSPQPKSRFAERCNR